MKTEGAGSNKNEMNDFFFSKRKNKCVFESRTFFLFQEKKIRSVHGRLSGFFSKAKKIKRIECEKYTGTLERKKRKSKSAKRIKIRRSGRGFFLSALV